MLLTVIAYAMIIVFMYVIMTKKLSPFTSLVMRLLQWWLAWQRKER